MRVLMLGWEFPPFIAGGLGVACYGLTKALDRLGAEVVFVLPKPVPAAHADHVTLLSPSTIASRAPSAAAQPLLDPSGSPISGFAHATLHAVPALFTNPYGSAPVGHDTFQDALTHAELSALGLDPSTAVDAPPGAGVSGAAAPGGPIPGFGFTSPAARGAGAGYDGLDLIAETDRYMRLVLNLARRERFDVIHAHDWLTYPAGAAVARALGKPLVVHVHSTEFDRAGANVNQRVYEIERAGMHAAARVIAVSQFTKSICVRRYGVRPDRVDVVYNGIDRESQQPHEGDRIESDDKLVLFLGRITMQKGPEYFIAAAKRVLEKVKNVKFVLAGSGDMALRMIELAASMGIGHKVLFTGFLRGRDVDRVFRMADCYVMPSVSEPFGIAALEAISHDVPVILSKTSGASEVLTHVLKVDFWDIDEMANKIIAVLRHPPLSQTLREHGSMELHRLTWTGAAERCLATYAKAISPQPASASALPAPAGH